MNYYLSIGTNLGNRCSNIIKAISLLEERTVIVATSSIYETEPLDMKKETPTFLNIVVKVEATATPFEMLKISQNIEFTMGRKKKSSKNNYENRIIDIDILLADNIVISTKTLSIPHKMLCKRAFALTPLCEINNNLKHPVTNKLFSDYLLSVDINRYVKKYDCKNKILNIQ